MDREAQVLYASNTPLESSMNPFLLIAAMSLGALQGSVAKAKAIDRTLLPYEKPGNLVSLRTVVCCTSNVWALERRQSC